MIVIIYISKIISLYLGQRSPILQAAYNVLNSTVNLTFKYCITALLSIVKCKSIFRCITVYCDTPKCIQPQYT